MYRFEYSVFRSPNFNAWEDKEGGLGGVTRGEYFATLPQGYVCVSYGISGLRDAIQWHKKIWEIFLGNFLTIFDAGSTALEAVYASILFNLTLGQFFKRFFNPIELPPSLCSAAANQKFCPSGQVRNSVTGACESSRSPLCPVGQFRDPLTGDCELRPCPEGLARNSLTGNCEPLPCPRGTFRDSETGRCVYPPCPEGKTRDSETGTCKSRPCSEGRVRNPLSGSCEYPPCPLGQVRDPTTAGACRSQCTLGKVRDPATGTCEYPPCPEGQVRDPTGICEEPCPETQVRDQTGSCVCPEGERLNPKRGKCQKRVVTDAWVDSDKADRYVEDKEKVIEEYGANGSVEVLDKKGQVLRRDLIHPTPSH